MKYPKDLTGLKFGKLTVVSKSDKADKNRRPFWNCMCSCGGSTIVRKGSLTSGATKSCNGPSHHLKKNNPSEYSSWDNMKRRCLNNNNPKYSRYGGRGITVCDRWLNSFENFFADMGKKPSPNHSIDRINNDGNYEPLNCKYSTTLEQANNTRTNVFLLFDGKSQTIAQWARELNVNQDTLQARLKYRGWSIERTLTTPVRKRRQS